MLQNNEPFIITYNFETKEGQKFHYEVNLDPQTFENINESRQLEDWMALDFHKCTGCPLSKEDSPQCPVAVGLSSFLDDFSNIASYEEVEVCVEVEERTYIKKAGLQDGLFSLMGLIMATSPCPQLKHLKPMARFHLPFATIEETVIRTLSFYYVKQFFLKKEGKDFDFDLEHFDDTFSKSINVNEGILKRIKAISNKDANSNSLVILDAFTKVLSSESQKGFHSIEPFFK